MLRASIESEGGEVDLRSLADGSLAEGSSIVGAGALLGLVEATLSGGVPGIGEGPNRSDGANVSNSAGVSEIAKAGDRIRGELGSAALVDAAAIIGNFERMVRIADATGIPLDAPVNVGTESIRADLGIDQYESAAHTAAVRGWQRALGRAIDPLLRIVLRWRGSRSKSNLG
jgi:hypothetical protein